MKYFLVLVMMVGVGCSSNPYKVGDLKDDVKSQQGRVSGQNVVLDKNNQVAVEDTTTPAQELKEQIWANYDSKKELIYDYQALKQCQNETADPRLGGNGEVTPLPELDVAQVEAASKKEIGVDKNGEVKIVTKQMYLDRIQAEQKTSEQLNNTLKIVKKDQETCERKLGYIRMKYNLPAQPYPGNGYFEGGQWVQTQSREQNLDDAFRIRNQGQNRVPASETPGVTP